MFILMYFTKLKFSSMINLDGHKPGVLCQSERFFEYRKLNLDSKFCWLRLAGFKNSTLVSSVILLTFPLVWSVVFLTFQLVSSVVFYWQTISSFVSNVTNTAVSFWGSIFVDNFVL